jgi:hypothetical protein
MRLTPFAFYGRLVGGIEWGVCRDQTRHASRQGPVGIDGDQQI